MTRKRIGGTSPTTGEFIVGGAVIIGGYLFIVKPLLDVFGSSPADQAAVAAQIAMPAQSNPFSAQFQPAVDYYNQHPGLDSSGNPQSISDAYQTIKAAYDAGTLLTLSQTDPSYVQMYQVATIAENLQDMYFWQFLKGYTSDSVMSQFSQITSQQELAEVAQYLLYNYNIDLLPALKSQLLRLGFGLSDTKLSQLITQMTNLPIG